MGMVTGLVMALWLAAVPVGPAAAPAARPVLQEIVGSGSGHETRFEVRVDRPVAFSFYTMPELLKGVVDLPGVLPGRLEPVRKIAAGPVRRILIREKELNGQPGTRIIFDLTSDAEFQVAADPLQKEKLVVRLTPKPVAATPVPLRQAAPTAPGKPVANLPAPVVPAARSVDQTTVVAARLVSAVRVNPDSLEIVSDGQLMGAAVFALKQPGRLVVDLADVRRAMTSFDTPANRFGIIRGRLGVHDGKLRIVFETKAEIFPPYSVHHSDTGLRITPAAP
ncbi:MAG TPA: AMIN domain-containing protein [Geobacteraceae bacterium]